MRRTAKVKALATPVPLRRAALSSAPASRRPFPAWIVADEGAVAFTARGAVSARVRAGLVLRQVTGKKKKASGPRSSDADRTR